MASVFKQNVVVSQRTPVEIVRDSLDVDAEGTVRFRCRVGRGSGKAVEIPGDQFNEFVTLMIAARDNHDTLVAQELEANAPSTEETISESDTPVVE